jgi:hypothetical protein
MAEEAFAGTHEQDEAPATERTPRRRRRAAGGASRRRSRIRLLYFGLASLWGFLTGAGALAIAIKATGQDVGLDRTLVLALALAAPLALLGAGVVAAAYREVARRTS